MSLVAALQPVVEAFERLGVRYLVGGSVASSAHGSPGSTNDIDLVAELRHEHLAPLRAALGSAYYAPLELLRKLLWFRAGDGVSDRQWHDILGILRLRAKTLDAGYLDSWAEHLGVADLLRRARLEVG